jgi:phage tail-like protein
VSAVSVNGDRAAVRHAGWLAAQLPAAMLEDPGSSDPFLRRFVQIFEDVAETVLGTVDGLEHHVDPAVCPQRTLPWLGAWLGLQIDGLPVEIQRRLVRTSGRLVGSRGTAANLAALVVALTGAEPTIEDGGGPIAPNAAAPAAGSKGVTVSVPTTGLLTSAQLEATLRREIPADAELELRVGAGAEHGSGRTP